MLIRSFSEPRLCSRESSLESLLLNFFLLYEPVYSQNEMILRYFSFTFFIHSSNAFGNVHDDMLNRCVCVCVCAFGNRSADRSIDGTNDGH